MILAGTAALHISHHPSQTVCVPGCFLMVRHAKASGRRENGTRDAEAVRLFCTHPLGQDNGLCYKPEELIPSVFTKT